MLKRYLFFSVILTFIIFFWALPALAEMIVDTAWVRRYNGPGNYQDLVHAIAVDGSGNVYVTGTSAGSGTSDDYATIKYYPNGDTAWVRRYNGPGNDIDEARAIALDSSGNVYVTGWSRGSGTAWDYATIKYNSNGDTAWVRRYNGQGNSGDNAYAIAVDGSGNVYVTGTSAGSGPGWDYATIKYYPNGDTGWVRRYNGPGNSSVAFAIAVDGSGNVYVTGESYGSGPDRDYATIKYYPNGDTAWVRRYNGQGNDNDYATAIAIDGSGNVYVTGQSSGSGTSWDYATIKYYGNGDTAWVRRYTGPGNSTDYARAIAVDGSGNAYVTGGSYSSETSEDYATIKYYPNGDTAWVRRYNELGNSNDEARAIAVDDSGNVYVTGNSYGDGTGQDYATIKYYSTGDIVWVRRYNGPAGPGNDYDYATAIAVDCSGFVYVTGNSYSSGTGYDYATIKYFQYPSPPFSLLSPTNNDTVQSTITFSWQYTGDLDPNDTLHYALYLSRSSVFDPESVVVYDSLTDTTFTDHLAIKSWYWKVKAYDKWGKSRWSEQTWSFYAFLVGDANGDGVVDIGDVVYLINFLFKEGSSPFPLVAGDANCSGYITVGDVVYLINYLFKDGPAPVC